MSYGYRQAVPFTATCPICHWKFESTESQTAANAKAARCGARPAATFKYEEGLEIKVPKSKGSKTFKTYKIVRRYTERVNGRHMPQYALRQGGHTNWDYTETQVAALVSRSNPM